MYDLGISSINKIDRPQRTSPPQTMLRLIFQSGIQKNLRILLSLSYNKRRNYGVTDNSYHLAFTITWPPNLAPGLRAIQEPHFQPTLPGKILTMPLSKKTSQVRAFQQLTPLIKLPQPYKYLGCPSYRKEDKADYLPKAIYLTKPRFSCTTSFFERYQI